MPQTGRSRGPLAFSLVELLCVIAMIGLLMAMLFPAMSQGRMRAKRVQCISNLRQIGIIFQGFAHDHNGLFPMAVPTSEGGSREFAENARVIMGDSYFSFRHFQVLSNELVTPKLLICPSDTRLPATSFALLKNESLSFFINLDAQYSSPNSVLSGDRNLTNYWAPTATSVRLKPGSYLAWTRELHRFKGNLLFADGHVEESNDPRSLIENTASAIVPELVLPTVTPMRGAGSVLVGDAQSGPRTKPGEVPVSPGSVVLTQTNLASGYTNGSKSNWVTITTTPTPRVPYTVTGPGVANAGETVKTSAIAGPLPPPSAGANAIAPAPDPGPTPAPAGEWFPSLAEGLLKDFVWGWYLALVLLLALTLLVRRKFARLAREKRRRAANID